jgi:hypothetical protein
MSARIPPELERFEQFLNGLAIWADEVIDLVDNALPLPDGEGYREWLTPDAARELRRWVAVVMLLTSAQASLPAPVWDGLRRSVARIILAEGCPGCGQPWDDDVPDDDAPDDDATRETHLWN